MIWDLEGLANPETPRGIISNIVRTLNKREPFLDKIYIPVKGSKSGKIVNMAAFCNGIVNASLTKEITPNITGKNNPLYDKIHSRMTNRVAISFAKYFSCLKENLKEEYEDFVFGNAGIPIMLYLLEPIVSFIRHAPSSDEFRIFTLIIVKFLEDNYPKTEDIKKLRIETTSESSRKNLSKQIGLYIRKEIKNSDFWPTMEQDESIKEIINMERRIGKIISDELAKISINWEKQRVSPAIYPIAKRRMDQEGNSFDENLSLGDELSIIVQNNNWSEAFEKIFTGQKGFKDKSEVVLAFNYLSKIRNSAAHGKALISDKEDLKQCEIYLQRLNRVIPELITDYSSPPE